MCKGTQKNIHIDCLNEWRNVNRNNPEKKNKCEICNFDFIIHTNFNYLNYKINIHYVDVFIIYFTVLFTSSLYGFIDYNCDFFTVKILNLFITEKCKILKYFRIMKKNNENSNIYDDSVTRTVIYTFFIITFVNFLIFSFLMLKTFKKLNQIENIQYNEKIKIYKFIHKLQQSFFIVFYYCGLITDNLNILISTLPIIFFCNAFSYSMYISTSNSILDTLCDVRSDVILSFENNPLLEIEAIED